MNRYFAAALSFAITSGTGLLGLCAQSVDQKLIQYGEHLSKECSSCHLRDGTDNGIPSIVGMKIDEFTETFGFYQNASRPNPAMIMVAQSLDDQQIQALAAYYASLPVRVIK